MWYWGGMIKMLAIKALVGDGLIKQLEDIDLPKDKENVIYKEAEEYSDWE